MGLLRDSPSPLHNHTVKLSTNYTIHAKIAHLSYFSGDHSFTFYTMDDEQIEIFGADFDDVVCFTRNFLVSDLKRTPKTDIGESELRMLAEIRDALFEYLKEDEE